MLVSCVSKKPGGSDVASLRHWHGSTNNHASMRGLVANKIERIPVATKSGVEVCLRIIRVYTHLGTTFGMHASVIKFESKYHNHTATQRL